MARMLLTVLALLWIAPALAVDFTLSSPAIQNNGTIPDLFTCNGDNVSPPLKWEHAPANTQSFVLTINTTDWGAQYDIYFWIIYNLPPDVSSLAQGIPELPGNAHTLYNFYNQLYYHGPCPPDSNVHHYVFAVYALDTLLPAQNEELTPSDFMKLITPHIIKQASFKATFRH